VCSSDLVPTAAEILDNVIPEDMQSYVDIVLDLTKTGQLDVALQVWTRANRLPGTVKLLEVTPLAIALLQNNRPAHAARLWQEATEKLAKPIPPDVPGSVLWDGGFEASFSYGGLGWFYEPVVKGVQIETDTQEKHSGEQSLRLLFAGRSNISFSEICHVAVIEPGRSYQLSGWVQTKRLTTDQGVRLVLYSSSKGKAMAIATPEVHGDSPWTPLTLQWTAPPDTQTASVCVARYPSDSGDGEIAGIAWIDDVALVPVAAERPHR